MVRGRTRLPDLRNVSQFDLLPRRGRLLTSWNASNAAGVRLQEATMTELSVNDEEYHNTRSDAERVEDLFQNENAMRGLAYLMVILAGIKRDAQSARIQKMHKR